jgi:hypothetical protein
LVTATRSYFNHHRTHATSTRVRVLDSPYLKALTAVAHDKKRSSLKEAPLIVASWSRPHGHREQNIALSNMTGESANTTGCLARVVMATIHADFAP